MFGFGMDWYMDCPRCKRKRSFRPNDPTGKHITTRQCAFCGYTEPFEG